MAMLTGSTFLTGLINSADVLSLLTQFGYIVAGIIWVMIILSPFFLAKNAFNWVIGKVAKAFGVGR